MKRLSTFLLCLPLMASSLFSQKTVGEEVGISYSDEGFVIVSPVEGTWANRQPLVLEVPEGYEVVYSFTGSHPMDSGFAYDGPVMIEAEGDVPLRIALVFPDGNAAIYSVDYSVVPAEDEAGNPADVNFRKPVITYTSGQKITIPYGFSYRLGNTGSYLPGEQVLSLQGGTFPHRYVSCEIIDGTSAWRFVLSPEGIPGSGLSMETPSAHKDEKLIPSVPSNNFTAGKNVELYIAPSSKPSLPPSQDVTEEPIHKSTGEAVDISEPPFQITDWGLLTFTRDRLIYSMDNDFWQEATGSVVLDRSVGHTISWQSVVYEKGNPIHSFYLPPKPTETYEFEGREAVLVALGADLTFVPAGLSMEPVSSLLIDAFEGEELQSTFPIEIYYNNLYQGPGEISLLVDKCPPVAPVINTSSQNFYNRQDVRVSLGQLEDDQLFYFLEMQVVEEDGIKDAVLDFSKGQDSWADIEIAREQFTPYNGEPLLLEAHTEHAHLFRVGAYSLDEQGNTSSITWYKTIVDPVNFYIAATSSRDDEDDFAGNGLAQGTIEEPFTSLEQAIEKTAHLDFVRLHVVGRVPVNKSVTISSHCEIQGTDSNSGLIFSPGTTLFVDAGRIAIKNCILEGQKFDSSSKIAHKNHSLLSVVNGNLSLVQCEVIGDYSSTGTIISATDGVLSIVDSGITLLAGEYGAMISSLRSSIAVDGGRYTVIAPTAVIFSLSAGQLNLSEAECRVYGNLGRVAELTGVGYSLTNNTFDGIFENKTISTAQLVPVWSDNRSRMIQNSGNIVSGFPGS